jgi:Mn2+/Fe2+ NRAMP family transporter
MDCMRKNIQTETLAAPTPPLDVPVDESDSAVYQLFKSLGPGLVTGASDDDPSGIATYSMAGAAYGFNFLWTAPLFLPLVACIEYICAKIAMVTGTGLAGVMRQHYSKPLLYGAVGLLFVANTINAGTDIGAIANAINLFIPAIPAVWLIPLIALTILAIQMFGSYQNISTVFKVFTLSLASYFFCVFFVKFDWLDVLHHTVVPHVALNLESVMMLVALLGTTISPYCFFWQATEEVEEELKLGRTKLLQRLGATDTELRNAALDVDFGMLISVVVMFFIMLTTGATLHAAGQFEINSAADAALALKPLAGEAASVIFSLGIIGTGFLAVPILTDSAAYAVAESVGLEPTLNGTPVQEKLFYLVISLSMMIGVAINFAGINPIQALYITAVINGVLAPPLLIVIMHIANNKTIMGSRVNGLLTNLLGWTTTVILSAASLALLGIIVWEQFS